MSWTLLPVAVGIAIGALSLLATVLFLRRLRPPGAVPNARVTLVMALTGTARGLPQLLRSIEAQTLKPHRILIAVESADDPAYRAIRNAVADASLNVEIVVAGLAETAGQKCVNIAAALDRLDARDDYVAFLDADIAPQPWWLSALVAPLERPDCGVVSGYRWPTIARETLGAHLILALDRGIAVLPRFRWTQAVWGGTIAMTRETAERLELGKHLRNRLLDDLTVGELARRAGIPVFYRRVLRVPTPLTFDLETAWRFGHRQYQLVRLYRPQLWLFALATVTLQLACWIALASPPARAFALPALATLFGLALTETALLDRIGKRLGNHDRVSTLPAQWLLCLAKPLVDLFHWSMIVAAARVRSVTWGHVRYRVGGPTEIFVTERREWPRCEH